MTGSSESQNSEPSEQRVSPFRDLGGLEGRRIPWNPGVLGCDTLCWIEWGDFAINFTYERILMNVIDLAVAWCPKFPIFFHYWKGKSLQRLGFPYRKGNILNMKHFYFKELKKSVGRVLVTVKAGVCFILNPWINYIFGVWHGW